MTDTRRAGAQRKADHEQFADRHGITPEQARLRLDESGAAGVIKEDAADKVAGGKRKAAGTLTGVAPASFDEDDKPSG